MYVEHKIHKSKYLEIHVFQYDLSTASVGSIGCFRTKSSLLNQKCFTIDSMLEWVEKKNHLEKTNCFLIECYFSCEMIQGFCFSNGLSRSSKK